MIKQRKILFIVIAASLISLIWYTRVIRSAGLVVSPPTQALGITVGVQQPPVPYYDQEITTLNSVTSKVHGLVLYYVDWSTQFTPYYQERLNLMPAANRPIIMVAWEPARGKQSLGCDQNYLAAVPWDSIIQGMCDPYIVQYALDMKARPERFLLKFAHEMNGGGTPWSPVNVGIHPDKFVAAWRHVHDIFKAQNVTNVEWVWAPIYFSHPHVAENDIHLYYPGDNYVDWVGPSGFNYFDQLPGGAQPWQTFSQLFDATLRDFACRYPKPQVVHETASVEDQTGAHHKTDWIADMYQSAQTYPFLRSVIWLNALDSGNPNADFRITYTDLNSLNGNIQPLPNWTNAYKNAVAASVFTKTLPVLGQATPPLAYCGDGAPVFVLGSSIAILKPGESSRHSLTGMLYSGSPTVGLGLPATFSGSAIPSTLPAPWGNTTINLQTSLSTSIGVYTVTVSIGSTQLPIRVIVTDTASRSYLPAINK